jgi:fused signal recognition particle receptor
MPSMWRKLADRIRKTRTVFTDGLQEVLGTGRRLDDALLEELEEVLIAADVGLETAAAIIAELRERAGKVGPEQGADARALLEAVIAERLARSWAPPPDPAPGEPHVILVVGVNGSGKTTSIGKLAHLYGQAGQRVLVVACDTFRAAALEQLAIWARRGGAELVRSQDGADPAAVAYDGVRAAHSRGAGVVLIDTAGRLQTNTNLMGELAKIRRVIAKAQPSAPQETLLTLDATVGQNALSQARLFTDAAPVTGIILAKLDGSAKGGVILAVADQLGIPVQYIGLGEGVEDLAPFDPADFARALIHPLNGSPEAAG